MISLPRWILTAALLTLGAGCSCGPKTPVLDGGTQDAGVDAGEVDAGAIDAGPADAGVVDAGPPPMLKILKVLPPRGGSSGGTNVLLQGSGFIGNFSTRGTEAKKVTTLKFGSNSVIDYQIIDDETLELRSPPGAAGPSHVTMTNPLGNFTCNSCFTYFDELVVNGISPKEGPLAGGNEVTLDGQGFTNDVEVLFGVFSSPKVTFVSSKQLKVIVPRAQAADLVDVTVYNKNGVSNSRRVYQYFDDVRITAVAPLTGPLAGGTTVTLTGTGFTGATSLKFGATDATSLTVVSDTVATAVSPAAAAVGAVDLILSTPRETWTAKKAFTYFDPAGAFAIFSVFPHVARPGETVTVTGQALDTGGLGITLDGVAATVGATAFSTATITIPARGAAARKSDVVATAGALSATLPQGFTWRLGVASVAPTFGPATGGTAATVNGSALPADAEVFFGALKGTATTVAGETSLSLTTPTGSGGAASDVKVREAADLENEGVLKAAFTFEEALSIGRVQPERGAVAGNTLVTVLGAGFRDGVTISFGPNKAKDVKIVDSHTVTCRTPKGETTGVVDVQVNRLTAKDELPGGFSYYDPRSISGGLSGGPLVGTLNISVLDATQGFYGAPVPLATVMLGIDANTPFQGLTDSRGQLTFSDASLVKAQVVTVFKEGYETATVTNVNAENLTVFISRTGGGDGSPGNPPPGPPRSQIAGRVTGFKAPRPLAANEKLEARVFVAVSSLFSGPPLGGTPSRNGEKWQVLTDGGEYLVLTNAGLHATYAVLGIANATAASFTPFLMGVKRGITTSPDNPSVNQDIILDMHLDLTVPVTVDSPLMFPGPLASEPGTNSIYAWLDLGAEGFIPNPNNWKTGTAQSTSIFSAGTMQSFPNFPRLDGSNFIFLNECGGAQAYPVSYYFRRQPGDLSLGVTIGPMLPAPDITQPTTTFNGTLAWNLAAGPAADIHQVQIIKPTLAGNLTLWSVVLPGSEKQVVLPAPAVTKLRNEEAGNQLFVVIYSSRSPKFAYNQWTYDTLSGVSWSSFTIAVSSGFSP
jgi:hypothetical protein